MPTAIIHETGSNRILKVVKNAVCFGKKVQGDSLLLSKGLKNGKYSIRWVDDNSILTPIMRPVPNIDKEEIIGYQELVTDFPEIADKPEIEPVDRTVASEALVKLNAVANMTFAQLDTYIDNNVDFTDPASVEAFVRILARALLGQIKVSAHFRK